MSELVGLTNNTFEFNIQITS